MKKVLRNADYLSWIHFGGFALMIAMVTYTLITGESPFESLGISPAAATLGMIGTSALLFGIPTIYRKLSRG